MGAIRPLCGWKHQSGFHLVPTLADIMQKQSLHCLYPVMICLIKPIIGTKSDAQTDGEDDRLPPYMSRWVSVLWVCICMRCASVCVCENLCVCARTSRESTHPDSQTVCCSGCMARMLHATLSKSCLSERRSDRVDLLMVGMQKVTLRTLKWTVTGSRPAFSSVRITERNGISSVTWTQIAKF